MSELKSICIDGTCAANTEYSGTGIVSVNDGVISADAYSQDQIDTKLNKVVMTDLSLPTNPSTTSVVLTGDKVNIGSGVATDKEIPLPVASTTQAGIINAATYQGIVDDHERVESLIGGSVAVSDLSATPTQSELTASWKNALGTTADPHNGAQIYDTVNNKGYTYFDNAQTWILTQDGTGATINVDTFTNNAEGLILGSTNDGQVFAETDGTGSVNGWDTLTADVTNIKNKFTGSATNVIKGDGTQSLVTASNIDWDTMPSGLIKPGDTMVTSANNLNPADIRGSSKQIVTTLYLPSPLDPSVTGCTASQSGTSSGNFLMVKGVSGMIVNYVSLDTFNVSCTVGGTRHRNTVRLFITKKDGTAFNVADNTPAVTQGTILLTFS